MNPTPNVNCQYGAPMGRPSHFPHSIEPGARAYLRRIPINSGGYDRGGAYWGLGDPLWWCGDDSGALDMFFRAKDRDAAKEFVRGSADVTFYR
jgi:hypothetical protein